jgi:hypothetical protein
VTPYAVSEIALCAELSPDKFAAYLVSQGYAHLGDDPQGFAVYDRLTGSPDDALDVPTNPRHADYGRRVYEVLEGLPSTFLGLLHAIDPETFPRERILVLAGITP